MESELVDAPLFESIHKLRGTREGILYLQQTGRFRDYMAARLAQQNDPARYMQRQMQREFLAWDGEGWTDNDLEHRYMYLACSEGYNIEYPQLSTVRCLDLMLTVSEMFPKRIHVIFGGGYDATHVLRDMPYERRKQLHATGQCTWNGYSFEYVAHKWFVVRRGKRRIKIFDVMTFFQSSFISALKSRGIPVPDEVTEGKANRSDFTFADLDEIKQYCRLELELLITLCNTLRDEFREAGLSLSQWYGPGAVATSTMRSYGVRKHKMERIPTMENIVASAYFGGRFEAFKVGHHPGKVYQYDINSAYPDKIRNLPSLRGARWVQGMGERDFSYPYRIGYVRYAGSHLPFTDPHPTPWRDKSGAVGFPRYNGGCWLWSFEWPLAEMPDDIYTLVIDDDTLPFEFIEGTFAKRLEWKRAGKGGERALKLQMNSLYGKFCQQIGAKYVDGKWKLPSWHQMEWGGMITSATRAQLWKAVQQNPKAVIAVETDSITLTEPIDLPCSENLGDWELKEYDWITYLQSGVYFVPDTDGIKIKIKSRGFDADSLTHSKVLDYLSGEQLEPLLAKARRFIALGNPRDHLYGQWLDEVRELSLNGGKRLHLPHECRACSKGIPASEGLHNLAVNPTMGVGPSKAYPLAWATGVEPNDPDYKLDTAEYDGLNNPEW